MVKDTIINTTSEAIDIINKVDTFYNSAWEKLLIFGTISALIIGIIVPFIIQYYQTVSLKHSEKLLEEKIENETFKIKNELETEFQNKIDKYFKEADIKIKKAESLSVGLTFHMQAGINHSKKEYKQAFDNYMKAGFNYLACSKYNNLRNCLKSMITCLNYMTIENIEDNNTQKLNINRLITDIEKYDKGGFTTNELNSIKSLISKLSKNRGA